MRTVAFFLLLVCTLSVSLRRQRRRHLRPMKRTSLMEIQSMLSSSAGQSGNKLNHIQVLLKGMFDKLQIEQSTQAGVFAAQSKDCDDEISFRESEVAEATIAQMKSGKHK